MGGITLFFTKIYCTNSTNITISERNVDTVANIGNLVRRASLSLNISAQGIYWVTFHKVIGYPVNLLNLFKYVNALHASQIGVILQFIFFVLPG